jgi:hypothetical protein
MSIFNTPTTAAAPNWNFIDLSGPKAMNVSPSSALNSRGLGRPQNSGTTRAIIDLTHTPKSTNLRAEAAPKRADLKTFKSGITANNKRTVIEKTLASAKQSRRPYSVTSVKKVFKVTVNVGSPKRGPRRNKIN